MRTHTFLIFLICAALAGACSAPPPDAAPQPASTPARPGSAPLPSAPTAAPRAGIRPVYEAPEFPDHPLASTLCEALHTLPARRRAECCEQGGVGFSVAPQCTRALSVALQSGAVRLDEAEVRACVEALTSTHAGCEWVGRLPQPAPAACVALIQGVRAVGQPCRASLECAEGLQCLNAGPTQAGQCAPPKPHGAFCNTGLDALAALTRQDSAEARHPECAGYCRQHRCLPPTPPGQPCSTQVECGPAHHCDGSTCQPGAFAQPGDPCADSGCAPGTLCIEHRCQPRKPNGAACTFPVECLASCVERDGARVCAPECSVAITAPPAPP